MKTPFQRGVLAACLVAASACSIAAHATGGAWREDMVRWSGMDHVDADQGRLVSRKEFLQRMGEAWDAQARATDLRGDRMTIEQYRAFAKTFGLDVGRP
jgi:hypothetical protein